MLVVMIVVCGQFRPDMDFDRLLPGGSINIRGLNPMKKEMRKKVETSGKIRGYVAGEGEFENRGQDTLGPKKWPKIIKNIFGRL